MLSLFRNNRTKVESHGGKKVKDKNPIEPLLSQITEILHKIQNHDGSISNNLTPQIIEEIERLESAIALFNDVNQKTFQDANIDVENLKIDSSRSHMISDKDKRVLKQAQEIEKDAKKLQFAFSKIMERGQKVSVKKEDPLKQKIKERRKRFKPLGGDKNWIPM
ncbi:hypothetical protein DB44_EN00020 [Candidatus Protochlamydia amoebophila]|uniref:Uncharacterized protein n=1 Tax=Candidatus Protochlamydia amoebophila TaxID=362787 RepID=A0A0C1JIF0_9BACT|nr:hypothetical protein DB44_EN00020 [Candidatus Protochlamydia amoebophila]